MSDQGSGTARPASHVRRSVLLLLLALLAFGAALWYVGGIDYVKGLLGGSPTAPSKVTSAKTGATTVGRPAGVDEVLAKRMYVEQIESSKNLAKMAQGNVSRFVINGVDTTDTTATVSLNAFFKDGTSAPGVMYLVKRSGSWYFLAIGGMNLPNASGLASGVGTAGTTELAESNMADSEEGLRQAGIKTYDMGVINSMLSQQASNQPVLTAVVAGAYTTLELGAPSSGAGTISVPVTLGGKSGAPVTGQLVFITKTIDGHEFTFLTTLKKL
jgi:hypothetical protein